MREDYYDKFYVLIKQWRIEGDEKAREELIKSNEALVHSIIKRFKGKLDYEDLFQLGMIGLIKAIDRFDINKNVKFSTYAVPVIIGEIKTFLRDNNKLKISRTLKEQGKRVKQKEEELAKYLNRSPTLNEISEELDTSPEEVAAALESSKDPLSIDYSTGENNNSFMENIVTKKLKKDKDDEIGILELTHGLDEKEKRLIIMRFVEEKSQKEVGEYLGINQVKVSRWERKILRKLREMNVNVV
ncbi:sigma-70 family RNA polymerase sigma factor [Natranaerofaba carboxydovora]|uniref:sigma-70 family RNA polymerase sigma factor n=1 Tax=Natranaerofaba carboxydovora TaxID=2742683 RepID=UPI001F144F77|nr:sigma-70 family RNA polymerase sigma factor [Natranaerofaba carboxydovora]UMZ73919.1 RNA polymerase sigma-F factor [Natranaerofaba carboxydovora]